MKDIFEDIRLERDKLERLTEYVTEYEEADPADMDRVGGYNTDRDITMDDQAPEDEETEETGVEEMSPEMDQIRPVEEDPHLVAMLQGIGDKMQGILDMERYVGDISAALAAYKQAMAERGTDLDPQAMEYLMQTSQLVGGLHLALLDVENTLINMNKDVLPGLVNALQGGRVEYDRKLGEWKIWGVTDPHPYKVLPPAKDTQDADLTDDQRLPSPPRGAKPGELVEVPSCRKCGGRLAVTGKSGTKGWVKCKCEYCGALFFMRESRRRGH